METKLDPIVVMATRFAQGQMHFTEMVKALQITEDEAKVFQEALNQAMKSNPVSSETPVQHQEQSPVQP